VTHSLGNHDVGCKVRVKLTLRLIDHYTMEPYGEEESDVPPPFLTSSDVVNGRVHAPAALSLVPIG
jgi:hypothetical protein